MKTKYLGLFISVGVVACGGDQDELEGDAETAATSAAATSEMAEVSSWFGRTEGAAASVTGEIKAAIVRDAEDAILAAMTPSGCTTVDTDEATYLEVTFAGCTGPGGRAGLDGTIRGELDFATEPCGPLDCPTATLWSLTAALTYGDGGALDGAWLVTAPIRADQPRTFDGAVTASGPYGVTVESAATATWTVDADGCVAVDATAEVTGSGVSLTVDGLVHCPGSCPSAGSVDVALRRGSLSWSYDGGAVATITGDDGRTLELALHCEP